MVCLVSSPALAQQQIPSEYDLKVTPDEINVISEGLLTQPYGKVYALMAKLRSQVIEQQQPKPLPKPAETPKQDASPQP